MAGRLYRHRSGGVGNTIASQKVELGRISLGLDFSMPLGSCDWTMDGGLESSWTSVGGTGAPAIEADAYEGGRARVELGLTRAITGGSTFRVSGFYDGLGARDFEIYGVALPYELPF